MTRNRIRNNVTVKEGFRHITTHSGWQFTYCGECTELLRRRKALMLAIIPEQHETLECDGCYAVNDTAALCDEIEIGAQQEQKVVPTTYRRLQ
jgi:hypothetical protein